MKRFRTGNRTGTRVGFDWKLGLATAGAILILVSSFFPLFHNKIISAVVYYTKDVINNDYPALVWGLQYQEKKPPLKQEFVDTTIEIGPTNIGTGSTWHWIIALINTRDYWRQLIGHDFCLIIVLLDAIIILFWTLRVWYGGKVVSPRAILPLFYLTFIAPFAILATLGYQFDFHVAMLRNYIGQLRIGIGFWGMLLGSMLSLVGVLFFARVRRIPLFTWWALVFGSALIVWLLTKLKPVPFADIVNFLSDGIIVTLRITTTSFLFILLVGLFGGLGRIAKNRLIRAVASLYVEIVRGIPLLVQLLFIWFALPQVYKSFGEFLVNEVPFAVKQGEWLMNLRLNPFTAAVMGLTICYGAYMSEIFRAGITSISKGQMEAARSLGMSYIQAMRYVILPQAIRLILPPVGNEFVALLKDSSLVSVLAVSDLTRRGREYMARTFLSLDTWATVALIYLVMTLFAARVVEIIERKTSFER